VPFPVGPSRRAPRTNGECLGSKPRTVPGRCKRPPVPIARTPKERNPRSNLDAHDVAGRRLAGLGAKKLDVRGPAAQRARPTISSPFCGHPNVRNATDGNPEPGESLDRAKYKKHEKNHTRGSAFRKMGPERGRGPYAFVRRRDSGRVSRRAVETFKRSTMATSHSQRDPEILRLARPPLSALLNVKSTQKCKKIQQQNTAPPDTTLSDRQIRPALSKKIRGFLFRASTFLFP